MTKSERYQSDILEKLLKKYYKRKLKYGQIKNGRRVDLKIAEVYRDYEKLNADMGMKALVNEAACALEKLNFITVKYLPYSDDLMNIYLNEGRLGEMEDYLEKRFGISARDNILKRVDDLITRNRGKGELTDYYCQKISGVMEQSAPNVDMKRAEELFSMLAFIQENEDDLYVREASVLVYGNSKYFESDRRCEEICSIIREATGKEKKENEQNDEILQQYHISNVEQEISLKGDFLIEIEDCRLETKYFSGGLSLSSRDIERIDRITVRTGQVMTVENKTSYYRFAGKDCSSIYLGGYANRHQVELLKKIYDYNPRCAFWHFGDIDVGGFLIHQHLCAATGIDFRLFHMGREELRDARYQRALISLTENDILRAGRMVENPCYRDTINEMLQRNVKLEQEIISYALEMWDKTF